MDGITILKIIAAVFLMCLVCGFALVKYALSNGVHVPTNTEIINGSKAYVEAKKTAKENPVKKSEPVKASAIRKLN